MTDFHTETAKLVEYSKYKLLLINGMMLLSVAGGTICLTWAIWYGYELAAWTHWSNLATISRLFHNLVLPTIVGVTCFGGAMWVQVIRHEERKVFAIRQIFDLFAQRYMKPLLSEERSLQTRTNVTMALKYDLCKLLDNDQVEAAAMATWLEQYNPRDWDDLLTMLRGNRLHREQQNEAALATYEKIHAKFEELDRERAAFLQSTEEGTVLYQKVQEFLAQDPAPDKIKTLRPS